MMTDRDALEDIKKRLDGMIQIGTISEVDKEARALAKVLVLGRESDYLPVMSFSSSFKRHYEPVREGEQVVVLCPFGEVQRGVILRGIFNKKLKEPDEKSDKTEVFSYENGLSCSIDTKENEIKLKIPGKLTIEVDEIEVKTSKKMAFKKGKVEFFEVLTKLFDGVKEAKTNTMLGPQMKIAPDQLKMELLNAKIKRFKG